MHQQAQQDLKRHVTATFILREQDDVVIGYYTLSAISLRLQDLPSDLIKKLPKYPLLPATLLGRLAIAEAHKGKRLGELLLIDALKKSLEASYNIASMAVIVDAKNKSAADFYKHYGFIELQDRPMKLFIPMATIKKIYFYFV